MFYPCGSLGDSIRHNSCAAVVRTAFVWQRVNGWKQVNLVCSIYKIVPRHQLPTLANIGFIWNFPKMNCLDVQHKGLAGLVTGAKRHCSMLSCDWWLVYGTCKNVVHNTPVCLNSFTSFKKRELQQRSLNALCFSEQCIYKTNVFDFSIFPISINMS